MADSKTILSSLSILTKQEIVKNGYALEDLWLIQNGEETLGPFHINQLTDLADRAAHEVSECLACNLKQKKWKLFFEHKLFQKRATQIRPTVKHEEVLSGHFHLLVNGQKKGPYKENQIKQMLEDGKIKRTDLMSGDQGLSWRKVHNFPAFDRRTDEEPVQSAGVADIKAPDDDQFEKSKVYTAQLLDQLKKEQTQTVAALEGALKACKEHLENKKGAVSETPRRKAGVLPKKFKSSSTVKSAKDVKRNAIAAVAVILIALLFILDGGHKKSSTTKQSGQDQETRETASENSRENRRSKSTGRRTKRSNYSSRNRDRSRNVNNSELDIPDSDRYDLPDRDVVDDNYEEPAPRPRKRSKQKARGNQGPNRDEDIDPLEDEDIIDRDIATEEEFADEFESDAEFEQEFDGNVEEEY